MRKKVIGVILSMLFVLSICISFVSCNEMEKFTVTFDYNVGNLIYAIEQQQVQVEKDGIIKRYPNNGIEAKTIDGYFIEGWYTAKVDSTGNVLVDSNRFVLLDKKWNFDEDKIADNTILFANWEKEPPKEGSITIVLEYQIPSANSEHVFMLYNCGDVYGTFTYNEPIINAYAYIRNKNRFEYCYYENKKYRVMFWYVPKLDDSHLIIFDKNGYAVIDRIWDFENDVITYDINRLILYAKMELIEE